MGLEHTVVRADDPAHDRQVHRVAAGERPAHLDAYDLTALCRGDDDRGVDVPAARYLPGLAGRVDTGHVGDEVGEGRDQPAGVDLGLDRRRVHRELGASGADQLDRPVDARGHHGVEQHRLLDELLGTGVQPLVAQHVVDECRHARIAGGEVVQDLVGLGPELAGRVRRERREFAPQLLQRPAQRLAQNGRQLGVPVAEARETLCLLLQLGGVPLGPVGGLGGVLPGERLDFGAVLLGELGDLGRMPFGETVDLVVVPFGETRDLVVVLLGQFLVGPAVGERHDGADQLVPVPHRCGRQVHRHLVTALGPEDLAAHPVLAAGPEGVGERRLLVGERAALRARMQDQRVEFLSAEVAGAEAEDLGGGGVDQDDPAVRVRTHDAFGGRPQDHFRLALRTGQLGLGVDGAGEIADDEHQQLVTGVAGVDVVVAGLAAVQ